uniref:Uncharacterized protein n=1 Tax=viral metagenome TaxID=1070528 RepID=A0A6H1ZNI6_9ZZZZ
MSKGYWLSQKGEDHGLNSQPGDIWIDDGESMAISNVLCERRQQDGKWGEQNHDPYVWLSILVEEVGEASKAMLESRFSGNEMIRYRDEMVQVAAVALAAIESFDRGTWEDKIRL